MPQIILPIKYFENSRILFDLKGYKTSKGIKSIIRINDARIPDKNPIYSLRGICGNYLICYEDKPNMLNFRKTSPLYFYGTLRDLRSNYRSEISDIELRLSDFKENIKKKAGNNYYIIPLDYLKYKMIIETNRIGLIRPIFQNIVRAIKENPECLYKNVNNIRQNLRNFPETFIQEVENKGELYSIHHSLSFYYNKKKRKFIQGQR